jgi:protein involved in polysaccharide export with SLBB domain
MNTTFTTGAASRIGRAGSYWLLVITLLLIAMAQATYAQQSTAAPQGLSQNSCRQIVVSGAVRTPSRLDAPQRLRLLEVLVKVGGPNERSGTIVRIVHSCNCSPCDNPESKANEVNFYNLVEVLRGRENGNPYVTPGDIVMVPEADSVFVMGNGITRGIIRFSEGMTVTRALAMAGSAVGRGSDLVAVRIYRKTSHEARQDPIVVRLNAILDGHAENVLLQPWDSVEVSDELGHFRPPKLSPPTWDPPLPKWNPPLHPRREDICPVLTTVIT